MNSKRWSNLSVFHCQLSCTVKIKYKCTSSTWNRWLKQLMHLLDGPNNTAASGSNIAAVGSSVTFSCSSDSRPQSQYKWYFSGLNVKNGSVYVTTPLSKSDSGQYTCMAFNSITGRSSDASVTLTVYGESFSLVLCLNETSKCVCSKVWKCLTDWFLKSEMVVNVVYIFFCMKFSSCQQCYSEYGQSATNLQSAIHTNLHCHWRCSTHSVDEEWREALPGQ